MALALLARIKVADVHLDEDAVARRIGDDLERLPSLLSRPVIRKASAHGLGHCLAPYGSDEESRTERDSGVRLWEEHVWKAIIEAAMSATPAEVKYNFRPEMLQPARSQYAATRQALRLMSEGWRSAMPAPAIARPTS